jgi:glucose/arabinose dehydrogenase/cytochrome c2
MSERRTYQVVAALSVAIVAAFAVWVRWRSHRAEVSAGRTLFLDRCSVCHGRDGEGAQGPSVRGIAGRKAASDAEFGYSPALRASNLTWDTATLDRFLAAPTELVPQTTMTIPTDSPADRKAIVAYLSTLRGSISSPSRQKNDLASSTPLFDGGLRSGRAAFGDFRGDAPGVRRRIAIADLPPPFATESTRFTAKIVDAPADAQPNVPPGFHIAQFAKNLKSPRLLRVAPNGDLFVAASDVGEIQVLRARQDPDTAENVETFAKGLDDPFGIAFYPAASPEWVYVAEANAVRRYPYAKGDLIARGAPETIVARLSPTSGGHTMRDIAFSHDEQRLFVAVGSASNVAEDLPKRSADEIRAFEAMHGVGAAWGPEESRAAVLVFDADGKNRRVFATGLRNCSGLTVHPETDEVWCAVNERDKLGENLVPDYVTRVRENGFYGWPWYYLGNHQDPRQPGARRDLAGKVALPDVLVQPHSAPLQIAFYEAAMFPSEYQGSAFVALHGSWNRKHRTGYKVVRIVMKDGAPTGEYEDFMTGFVIDDERVWARPVGVAVGNDGALYVGEDGNGTIWRVTYQ